MRTLVLGVFMLFCQFGWAQSQEFVLLDGIDDYNTHIQVSESGAMTVVETLKIKITQNPMMIKRLRTFSYGKLIKPRVYLNQQELALAKQPWYRAQAVELDQEHMLGRGEHTLLLKYRLFRYLERNSAHGSLTWNVTGLRSPMLVKSASVHISIPEYHNFLEIQAKTGARVEHADYQISKHQENNVILETTKLIDKGEDFIVSAAWTH